MRCETADLWYTQFTCDCSWQSDNYKLYDNPITIWGRGVTIFYQLVWWLICIILHQDSSLHYYNRWKGYTPIGMPFSSLEYSSLAWGCTCSFKYKLLTMFIYLHSLLDNFKLSCLKHCATAICFAKQVEHEGIQKTWGSFHVKSSRWVNPPPPNSSNLAQRQPFIGLSLLCSKVYLLFLPEFPKKSLIILFYNCAHSSFCS